MKLTMRIEFWGVRGSIPSPGSTTQRYGGNTCCVSIRLDSNKVLVLDAGTGIRNLGKKLEGGDDEIYIILSHNHWDHIQGFPFFSPIYEPKRKIKIFSTEQEKNMICSLIEQIDGAHFPVMFQGLPALRQCININIINHFGDYGFNISRINTNHHGECYGYRIDKQGHSLIYLTDNELDPPYKNKTRFDEFVQFCLDSDILIHDAQYINGDIPQKYGWGHSLATQACKLAASSRVKNLILFHHDPDRTDDELDIIQEKARNWLQKNNSDIQCSVAYEGLILNI